MFGQACWPIMWSLMVTSTALGRAQVQRSVRCPPVSRAGKGSPVNGSSMVSIRERITIYPLLSILKRNRDKLPISTRACTAVAKQNFRSCSL